jgi:hypothetical protein
MKRLTNLLTNSYFRPSRNFNLRNLSSENGKVARAARIRTTQASRATFKDDWLSRGGGVGEEVDEMSIISASMFMVVRITENDPKRFPTSSH